jgi:hypothetical protein
MTSKAYLKSVWLSPKVRESLSLGLTHLIPWRVPQALLCYSQFETESCQFLF